MAQVDIAIPFNEVPFKDRSYGFIRKTVGGKPVGYVSQILALARSINKNWPEAAGTVHALHSEPLSTRNKDLLEGVGVHVLYRPVEPRHGLSLLNKITAYEPFSDAEFTLQLDADMLVLSPVPLGFDHDVSVGYEADAGDVPPGFWEDMFGTYGLNMPEIHDDAYKQYQTTGNHLFQPCVNNGAVLVRNSYKETLREHILDAEEKIVNSRHYAHAGVRHFLMELSTSMAFHRADSKSYLPTGVNFLGVGPGKGHPSRLPLRRGVSLYHYVGPSNPEVDSNFREYFSG